ncbi:unnamed protein product [Vitrella brassicaformis CCMP3155]|uniref:Uncharacterized protein n=1 Tax=Vitrella brassicaformis (strain CCMP3155) TaxID=1169540 RepID=A0A0G4EIX4_VITBC|nr:unnamed protein product [Vitrella brassicaformis CCMP3155]|eukprot:CEL95971.1 unnamed protein product [Vitrella brassicaformis CCMP3155]
MYIFAGVCLAGVLWVHLFVPGTANCQDTEDTIKTLKAQLTNLSPAGGGAFLHWLAASINGFAATKQMLDWLRKQSHIVNQLIASNGGQLNPIGPLDGEIEVNVGGTVLCVPRKPLLLPGVSDSFIAYLLLHHLDGLPKDTEGRPFLDADPVYMEWLFNEITGVGVADAQGESHEIKLTGDHSTDSSSVFWHHLLFDTKTSLGSHLTRETGASEAAINGKDPIDVIKASASHVEAAMADLVEAEKELKRFHKMGAPFFKPSAAEEGQIKSVRVLGKTISTTEADHIDHRGHTGACWPRQTTLHDIPQWCACEFRPP